MSVIVRVDWSDLKRLENMFEAAGDQAPHAVRRALNHVGDRTRTRVVRLLAQQTGAKSRAIRAALTVKRATYSRSYYSIMASGSHIPLKEFGARQAKRGVSAKPWNKRRIFGGTFVVGQYGGNAFRRTGDKRFPIKMLWGPAIPKELVKDETAEGFMSFVGQALPDRIGHELGQILSGGVGRASGRMRW